MSKQIWFYDNDMNNAPKSEIELIKFIKIPEIGNNDKLAKMSNRNMYPDYEGVSSYFYEKLKGTNFERTMNMELYDPLSGIQEAEIFKLKDAASKGEVLAVVFDWDRTLTKIEGLYTPVNYSNIGQYLDDLKSSNRKYFEGIEQLEEKGFIDYLFHNNTDKTEENIGNRSKLIGLMIKSLQNSQIPTFILTNNRTANNTVGRKLFKQIIDGLLEPGEINFPLDNILYNFIGNKERMIMGYIMSLIPEEMQPKTISEPEPEPEPEPEEYKAEPERANNNINANNLARQAASLETTSAPIPRPRPERPVPRPRPERPVARPRPPYTLKKGGSRKLKRKSKRLSKNNKKSKKLYKNSKKSKRLSKTNRNTKKS